MAEFVDNNKFSDVTGTLIREYVKHEAKGRKMREAIVSVSEMLDPDQENEIKMTLNAVRSSFDGS